MRATLLLAAIFGLSAPALAAPTRSDNVPRSFASADSICYWTCPPSENTYQASGPTIWGTATDATTGKVGTKCRYVEAAGQGGATFDCVYYQDTGSLMISQSSTEYCFEIQAPLAGCGAAYDNLQNFKRTKGARW